MGKGLENCQIYGNIAAGIPLKEAQPYNNPLLKESRLEMLPDFYVADVEQTNLKERTPTVRTVCFSYRIEKLSGRNDIKLIIIRALLSWLFLAFLFAIFG